MKKWQCSVCGYVHTGDTPPDKCPVCGADQDLFMEQPPVEAPQAAETMGSTPKADKWRCTICGYVHEGPEPPETCPVCGADRSLFEPLFPDPEEDTSSATEKKTPQDGPNNPASEAQSATEPSTNLGRSSSTAKFPPKSRIPISIPPTIAEKIHQYHAHPIMVHIPNGLLPVSIFFTFIAAFFGCSALDTAAFCNQVMVLLAMPIVMLTGYSDWQHKFGGYLTTVFKIKIGCAAAVTAIAFILVLWRIIQPQILSSGASGRGLYLLLELLLLAAATVAGLYGGKLVFKN